MKFGRECKLSVHAVIVARKRDAKISIYRREKIRSYQEYICRTRKLENK